MNKIKVFMKTPFKNKIAVLVIMSVYPLSLIGDAFVKIGEYILEFVEFILRWMEFWTGVRQ